MKRMLDLLYAGIVWQAINAIPNGVYFKYAKMHCEWLCDLNPDDRITMLLLIAVAEGEQL